MVKNIPAGDDDGAIRRGVTGRCWLKRGRAARVMIGAATVEKKVFVFFALSALREMRETLRVISIVVVKHSSDRKDKRNSQRCA